MERNQPPHSEKELRLVGNETPAPSAPVHPLGHPSGHKPESPRDPHALSGPYAKIRPGGRTGWREDLAPGGNVVDRRMFRDRRELKDPRLEGAAGPAADQSPSHTTSHTTGHTGGQSQPSGEVQRRRGDTDSTGLERRRGVGRRLSDFTKSAEEGQMTPEQFLFLVAIDSFKKANDLQFPTWTDVLEVIRLLGYRKTMASAISLPSAEDWKEAADAPAGVRAKGWEKRAG